MIFVPVKGVQGEVSFQHDTLIVSELSRYSVGIELYSRPQITVVLLYYCTVGLYDV